MANGIMSFWGPVTSTPECYEKNYDYSSYIAELFNTISNIPCILLAFVGLMSSLRQQFEKRFIILHISNMVLAVGSMIYHATLRHVLQQSDETPIVWQLLIYIYILYSPDWHYQKTMPTFLFLYAAGFAVVHSQFCLDIGLKVHFVILCLLCVPRMHKYYIYTDDFRAKRVARLYALTLILSALCWLFDRAICKDSWPVNPRGHALWHILMGFNLYFANMFLMFWRAKQRGWVPRVLRYMGILPYVKIIKKPKSK